MTLFITVLHVLVCLILVLVVLLQRGKGAEIGAVFGGGASSTVFGSRGAGNFFTRLTTGAAIVFMATSLTLAYLGGERSGRGLFDDEEPAAAEESAGESPFEPLADPEAQPGAETPSGFGEVGEPAEPGFGEVGEPAEPGFGEVGEPAEPGFGEVGEPAEPETEEAPSTP